MLTLLQYLMTEHGKACKVLALQVEADRKAQLAGRDPTKLIPEERQALEQFMTQNSPSVSQLKALGRAPGFAAWADAFLAANPPVEVFYPGNGLGVKLNNQASVLLCAQASQATAAPAAQMQDSGSVPITQGQSPA